MAVAEGSNGSAAPAERWADMSSNEDLSAYHFPKAPVIDSQISYSRMDSFGGSRSDLTRKVEEIDLKGTADEDEFVPLAATRKRQRMCSPARGDESSQTPTAAAASFAGRVSLPTARSAADVEMEAAADVPVRPSATATGGDDIVPDVVSPSVSPSREKEQMPGTEEDHQRRTATRQRGLGTVKCKPDYMAYDLSRLAVRPCTLPRTPDPEDRTVSKRDWETSVMEWRKDLRQWSAAAENDPAVTAASLVVAAD